MTRIGFIGAGNMACSMIGGLLQAGHPVHDIRASDPAPPEQAKALGIEIINDNAAMEQWADVLVLAVKPQVLQSICAQIAAHIANHHVLVVSIAAGIKSDSITGWLGTPTACIRVMPNTPALLGLGMSGLYANEQSTAQDIETATTIMQTVGKVIRFPQESMIDIVTAMSGSGPAYFFLMIEAMIKSGTSQGLSEEQARMLAAQTASGAATMAMQSDSSIEELRRRVTSPGGTTERAIQTLIDGGFIELVDDAIRAAAKRSVELSRELAGDNDG
jgi:pyrroline-5-carboxylate reductase